MSKADGAKDRPARRAGELSMDEIIKWATDDGSNTVAPLGQLRKLLMTWVHIRLRKSGIRSNIMKLADLRDKMTFHRTLLAVLGETVPESNGVGKKTEEELSADEWSLLSKHKINLVGVTRESVESGDYASGLALLWCLFITIQAKLFVQQHQQEAGEADEEASSPSRTLHRGLLRWYGACVAEGDPTLVVTNLHHCWCDGRYHRALVKALPSDEMRQPVAELDESSSLTEVLQLLKDALGLDADRLLGEGDLLNRRNLGDKAMLVHLALIHEQFFTKAPRFSRALALRPVDLVQAESAMLLKSVRRCQDRYNFLEVEESSITASMLNRAHHAYFVELLITSNGICLDSSGESREARRTACELFDRWQVKRRQVWQGVLSHHISELVLQLTQDLADATESLEMIKEQLPCEAEQLHVAHASFKESFDHLCQVYSAAQPVIKSLERFVRYNSALFAEDGSSAVLMTLNVYQKLFSSCRRATLEFTTSMNQTTQACSVLDQVKEVEDAISVIRRKCDFLSSYEDLRQYLDQRRALLAKATGLDEKLQASQESLSVVLTEHSALSVKDRIERGHTDLSRLSTPQQKDLHARWSNIIEEIEAFRASLSTFDETDGAADQDEALDIASARLKALETGWKLHGDNTNLSMCISSQLSLERQGIDARYNKKRAQELVESSSSLVERVREALEEQSSTVFHDPGFSQLQAELQKHQDLEHLNTTLGNQATTLCGLVGVDSRTRTTAPVAGEESRSSQCLYLERIQAWTALCNQVKQFLPVHKKRLEFYSKSRPLEDELMSVSSFLASLRQFSGPLAHVQGLLEQLQTYKLEKLKKLKEDFNCLSEVAEELTYLVAQNEYDHEETALHKLEAILLDVEKEGDENNERLAKAVEDWRLFTDELEQAQEEVNSLFQQAVDLTDHWTTAEKSFGFEACFAAGFPFEVKAAISRQERLLEESENLMAKFRQHLLDGCKEADAEELDRVLHTLLRTCDSIERKAQRLATTPLIWISHAEDHLKDTQDWFAHQRGPTDLYMSQLMALLERVPDVLLCFDADPAALPPKPSPDPRPQLQQRDESKELTEERGEKEKYDSGYAESAAALVRNIAEPTSLPLVTSPTSPSIEVTPADGLSQPMTPTSPAQTPAQATDSGQEHPRTPEKDEPETGLKARVVLLDVSLRQVLNAAGIWEVQAGLHEDIKRRLWTLNHTLVECEDVPDIATAAKLLCVLTDAAEKEMPVIQECMDELLKNLPEDMPVACDEAVQAFGYWNRVHDQVGGRLCVVKLAVEERLETLKRMVDTPRQALQNFLAQLQGQILEAQELLTKCEGLKPNEVADDLAYELERVCGKTGEEQVDQLLHDCDHHIDLVVSVSPEADVSEYTDRLAELESQWQSLCQKNCSVLLEFHLKNKLLSDILDGWCQCLDRADSLTAVSEGLSDEVENLENQFSESSSDFQVAVDCLSALEQLSSASPALQESLWECLRLTEERHSDLVTRASSATERLRSLLGAMRDQTRKLEELRLLVERLEEEVQAFGTLLDSVDGLQNAEHDLQSAQRDWNIARQQKSALPEDIACTDICVQLDTMLNVISDKLSTESSRLRCFTGLWRERGSCYRDLQSLQSAIQLSLNGLADLTSWLSTLSAIKIMFEAHDGKVDDARDLYQKLLRMDNELLDFISEPFANRLSLEARELGQSSDDLTSRWDRWKEAETVWLEVREWQRFVQVCLDSVHKHCYGHLLAACSAQDSLKSELESCRSKVAHVRDAVSSSLVRLIPDRFQSEVVSVSSKLVERYTSVHTLSVEFFTASQQAQLLVSNVEKIAPAISGGSACLDKQAGVLGPADAIERAQQSIKDHFAEKRSLVEIERVIESCHSAASELFSALGRGQLRASQFPEFSDVGDKLDVLQRQSDHLRTKHGITCAALQELGALWSQLLCSCKELEDYVARSRAVFPGAQELGATAGRHDMCSTKLHEMNTCLRTAQTKATVIQAYVSELQSKCEADPALCDQMTQRYRAIRTCIVTLELASKLLAVVVDNGIVRPLHLENEVDLQTAAIQCQGASQGLAGLRKRLDTTNATIQAAAGGLGQLPPLVEEEALVKKLVEDRASMLNGLRMLWLAAKKHVSEAAQWVRDATTEVADLSADERMELTACTENLGRVQGLLSQHGQYKEKLDGIGTQLARLTSSGAAHAATPRVRPPPSTDMGSIAEEDEDVEGAEASRSDVDALRQRYTAACEDLARVLARLTSCKRRCEDRMRKWSELWTGLTKMQEVCERAESELSRLDISKLQSSQWTAGMGLVQKLQEELTSFESMISSQEGVLAETGGESATSAEDADGPDSGSQSARMRMLAGRRNALLCRLEEVMQELKEMASMQVEYRGRLRNLESATRQFRQDFDTLCHPVDDWSDVGARQTDMQTLQRRTSNADQEVKSVNELFGRLKQHLVGNETACTRHQQCCEQRAELLARVQESLHRLVDCSAAHESFQRGVRSIRHLTTQCSELHQRFGVDPTDESLLEALLQDMASLGEEVRRSAADDHRLLQSIDMLAKSKTPHRPVSIQNLRTQYDRCCAARQVEQELLAKLEEEWQGVGRLLPRVQDVLHRADADLEALQDVLDSAVPVGVDTEDRVEVFAAELSQAHHHVMEINRRLQELTADIPAKIFQVLNLNERLHEHWRVWTELEAKAEAARLELAENHARWLSHRQDVELVQQWVSGVRDNVRALHQALPSTTQKLKAAKAELQVLLSKGAEDDTCAAQAALVTQLQEEAGVFCEEAPLSTACELHGQALYELAEEIGALVAEAERLCALVEARLECLTRLNDFLTMMDALNQAAAGSAESLSAPGSRQASLNCLQDIESNFSKLRTQLEDLVALVDEIDTSGALQEQLELARHRWAQLENAVSSSLESQDVHGHQAPPPSVGWQAALLWPGPGSHRAEFLALLLLAVLAIVAYLLSTLAA